MRHPPLLKLNRVTEGCRTPEEALVDDDLQELVFFRVEDVVDENGAVLPSAAGREVLLGMFNSQILFTRKTNLDLFPLRVTGESDEEVGESSLNGNIAPISIT